MAACSAKARSAVDLILVISPAASVTDRITWASRWTPPAASVAKPEAFCTALTDATPSGSVAADRCGASWSAGMPDFSAVRTTLLRPTFCPRSTNAVFTELWVALTRLISP